jgi:phosphatidylinositol glycan class T
VQAVAPGLLVPLAAPDFSMPYNVLCLSSTLLAVHFGLAVNLLLLRKERPRGGGKAAGATGGGGAGDDRRCALCKPLRVGPGGPRHTRQPGHRLTWAGVRSLMP